jgi:hypothetical protein
MLTYFFPMWGRLAACGGVAGCLALAATVALAGDTSLPPLKPAIQAQYEAYIRAAEAHIHDEVRSPAYLWAERSPARWQRVRDGQVAVEPFGKTGDSDIGGAIIHDWIGAAFIPGVKLSQVVSFLQDYPSHKNYYGPEVTDTRLLGHEGNVWNIHFRLVESKVVTVVLDVDQAVTWYPVSSTRQYTSAAATSIVEATAKPGHDRGYLWRLNTYWRLEEKDGGVYIESRNVSLSRSPPFGLAWLFNPIISSLPGESLGRLLTATRNAVRSRSLGPPS